MIHRPLLACVSARAARRDGQRRADREGESDRSEHRDSHPQSERHDLRAMSLKKLLTHHIISFATGNIRFGCLTFRSRAPRAPALPRAVAGPYGAC